MQALPSGLAAAIETVSAFVNGHLINPPQGISNVSEWAKREACWIRILGDIASLDLPEAFHDELVSVDEVRAERKDARKVQKIDNGINDQMRVIQVGASGWRHVREEATRRKLLTEKEIGILRVAEQIPARLPTEKQSAILIEILERAESEGIAAS